MPELALLPERKRVREHHPEPERQHVAQHFYYAFLSYSHRDQKTADWLHDQLERFRVPSPLVGRLTDNGAIPKRLTPIFRDRQELAAATDLGCEIRHALASSRFLIVLCSPAAAQSEWTNAEVDAFKRTRPDGCVLAAIIDGEPFASDLVGREAEECLPPALRVHYDRRGRPTGRRAEPLAADLREGKDGKRLGLLKIVAGMLGIGLDELVQRETLRRHRHLAFVAAASIAGMAVTTTLAVTAISARDSAREQRRQAEGLVGFMLGDLRSKLEPIGRLDALDGVGSRVLDYYKKQDMYDLPDGALMQRARALSLMGEVARLRGDLDGALRQYGEALAGTGEAVRRDDDDTQRLFDHSQNVFWVAEIARLRGQTASAEQGFREYKRLADRMVSLEPDNLKWRVEVKYAEANLGIVYLEQRRFPEAVVQFQRSLAAIQAVAALDRDNADYQKSVAESLAWLADAERDNGRLASAIAHREQQLALLNGLMASSDSDVEFRQKAIPAEQALGRLYASRGQLDRGIEHLRLAVSHASRLMPIEPDNSLWVEFAASARLALAEHLLAAKDQSGADAETRAGCDLISRLLRRDPNAVEWRSVSRNCATMRARVALDSGAPGAALAEAERALKIAQMTKSGDATEDRYVLAGAYRLVGDIKQRSGNVGGARQAWSAALAALPKSAAERPVEASERAELLKRLGRNDEARPLAERLRSLGYKATA